MCAMLMIGVVQKKIKSGNDGHEFWHIFGCNETFEKKSNPILAVTELGEKVNYLVLDTLDFCLGSVMFMVGQFFEIRKEMCPLTLGF